MGYTTRFTGQFKIEPPLTVPHFNELKAIADGKCDEGPGGHCQWTPTDDGEGLRWDCGEKFYDYDKWLQFLIDSRLRPWGHTVTGAVRWQGEAWKDVGVLSVENGKVSKHKADGDTIQVFVPKLLIERHRTDGDCADKIAESVVASAKQMARVDVSAREVLFKDSRTVQTEDDCG